MAEAILIRNVYRLTFGSHSCAPLRPVASAVGRFSSRLFLFRHSNFVIMLLQSLERTFVMVVEILFLPTVSLLIVLCNLDSFFFGQTPTTPTPSFGNVALLNRETVRFLDPNESDRKNILFK